MTYEQALAYIHGTEKFGSKPGLARISALLESLGDPQKKLKFIHVAGTNGKGSTTAMTAAILGRAGYTTGMYISPFVEDFRERITLDGQMISKPELSRRVTALKAKIDVITAGGGMHPTEFEIITALALWYFSDMRCDFVVLEVGLGGRWDATNVVPAGNIAVITSISMDHMHILGDTLSKIASEKCGIIKPECLAVTSAGQPGEAMAVIRETCDKAGVRLYVPDPDGLKVLSESLHGTDIAYKGKDLHIPLLGAHQVQNALTVLEIIEALRDSGYEIPDTCVREGLACTRWGGRLEIVRDEPLCVVDGAHNADAVRVLCAALDKFFAGRRIIAIMGMMKDKEYEVCIPMVAERCAAFLGVSVHGERALDAQAVAHTASGHCAQTNAYESIPQAVAHALRLAGKDDVILACGSLYIIGEIKQLLQQT